MDYIELKSFLNLKFLKINTLFNIDNQKLSILKSNIFYEIYPNNERIKNNILEEIKKE